MPNDKKTTAWPIEGLDINPVTSTTAQAVSGSEHFIADIDRLIEGDNRVREHRRGYKAAKKENKKI